jgi:uncharacterized integral membrane protein
MDFRKVIAFLILVLLGVFVFMNRDDARVWFFGIRAEMPIALLVITAGGIGMAVGFLLTFVRGRKKSGADAA